MRILGNNEELLSEIEKRKQEFYSNNTKNTIFKNNQKIHCASEITQKFDIQVLLNNTSYIIPNTNIIYFDYTVFKQYACPENYNHIVTYMANITNHILGIYPTYEFHINLNTFSISAFDRYRPIIDYFLQNFQQIFSKNTLLCIYNSPNIIGHIQRVLKPFVPNLNGRIVYYSKEESLQKLNELLAIKTT